MIKCVDPSVLGVLLPNPYNVVNVSRGLVRTRAKSRSWWPLLRRTSTICAIRTSTSCARCRREPCGNRITASARRRGGQLSSLVDSAQVAHRAHHEEVRPRQDVTPCPSLHHSSRRPPLPSPSSLSIAPGRRRNSQSILYPGLPARVLYIDPTSGLPARPSTPSDTSYLTKVVYIF